MNRNARTFRRFILIAGFALLTTTASACAGDEPAADAPADTVVSEPAGEPGQVGGAGIRSQKANLYLNTDSLDEWLGTRDGDFGQFTATCTEEQVTVVAGDDVSAVFTVGGQEVTFFLGEEEFATVTGEAGDEVEWGAGSSFAVSMLQVILDNDHRVTFSGSVSCP